MANQPTENDDPLKDWLNSMQTLQKSVDHDYIQSCSISIVPEGLKRSNEDAYTPRVVSMGPRHKGSREDLLLVEEVKLRSMLENQIPILLLHHLSRTLFSNFFTEDREERANKINNLALSVLGYTLPQFHSPESPHILDLVHSFVNRKQDSSPSDSTNNHHVVGIMDTTQRVKRLKLKRCASRLQAAGVTIKLREDITDSSSVNSCCGFLRNCFGGILISLGSLIVTAKPEDMAAEEEDVRGLDFGFKFSREKGKLEIAQLHITKTTKAKWRNVIAWEHHKKNRKSSSAVSHTGYESGDDQNNQSMMTTSPDPTPSGKFNLSALIFDGLICCAADVKLLKDKNIIVDHMKMSNGEVEEFFRTMSFGVDQAVVDDGSSYYVKEQCYADTQPPTQHPRPVNKMAIAGVWWVLYGARVTFWYVKMVDDLNNYSEAFFPVRICKTGWHLFTYRLVWLVKFMTRNYNFVATVLAALNVVQVVYVILAFYLRE